MIDLSIIHWQQLRRKAKNLKYEEIQIQLKNSFNYNAIHTFLGNKSRYVTEINIQQNKYNNFIVKVKKRLNKNSNKNMLFVYNLKQNIKCMQEHYQTSSRCFKLNEFFSILFYH